MIKNPFFIVTNNSINRPVTECPRFRCFSDISRPLAGSTRVHRVPILIHSHGWSAIDHPWPSCRKLIFESLFVVSTDIDCYCSLTGLLLFVLKDHQIEVSLAKFIIFGHCNSCLPKYLILMYTYVFCRGEAYFGAYHIWCIEFFITQFKALQFSKIKWLKINYNLIIIAIFYII